MKPLILLIALLTSSAHAELAMFGGFFVFDDEQTQNDYNGLSPMGEFGIEYRHQVDNELSVSVGYKHQSSALYREEGEGFNGPFVSARLVIWK